MLRGVAIVALVGATGCLDIPGPASGPDAALLDAIPADARVADAGPVPCADLDGDHWLAGETGDCLDGRQLDCNDDDAAIHPGAREVVAEDRDCHGTPWDGQGAIPPIVAGVAGGDLEVTVGAMSFELDDAAGHALASLTLGNSGELIYQGVVTERLVGVEAFPTLFSRQPGDNDTRTVLVDTPATLRVRVSWADGTELTGTTTWTVHAGGRGIYRREELTLNTTDTINNVTSFQTFNGEALGFVDWESNTLPAEEVDFGPFTMRANAAGENSWLCAFRAGSPGYEVGMLSRPDATSPQRSSRLTTQTDGNAAEFIALQYDWRFNQTPTMPSTYAGNFLLLANQSVGVPCSQVEAAEVAWDAPPQLSAVGGSGTVVPGSITEDRDGDGYSEAGGFYTVQASSSPLVIELASAGTIAGYTVFRLIGLPPGEPYLERDDGSGAERMLHVRDYLLFEDATTGDRWLVTVAMPGDQLRIVSP